ncbi:SDR family NAD(P)-dependent oxidoreductase [Brevundimonas lenta]|uniref:NAD(P)-dependent dehydrogenase (Short-subunit alcohol dehydrogenase family) n=1 Tax=Brevundimonas lenta TaxID=424796 RepID=A0A7W6NNZ2_9CAUL|nr:SDR family NAD(P)-dependent oxidoreductase [Brevundimonas lenta]MBB4081949.1 NAD(P)-dependent dehydrogenase (short-subunit alcohol dehydrogenase family) [Brevundimonas lenta]
MTIDLSHRTAIVTGAGGGLGRSHAIALAKRGARVVVNDLSPGAADAVAAEIQALGGKAMPWTCSVTDRTGVEDMVRETIARWGSIDIVVNNAGILRDRTFANLDLDDFAMVIDVHVMGSVNLTKAVWPHMREQGYGRIVFTTSSSGLYGNFGQSNYSAAKMALVGLMQTLALEGQKYGIHVNCLAPSAATQMTEKLYSPEDLRGLSTDLVSPGVVALVSENAPTRTILLAGAGAFEQAHITMTNGIHVGDADDAAEQIEAQWARIADRSGEQVPESGAAQYHHEVNHPGKPVPARAPERVDA